MKRQTKTFLSAHLASYPYGTEFVADRENRNIKILLSNEKFLDLLIMLDMAYALADGADDEHTKHEISLMVLKLIRQYQETQNEYNMLDWQSKCYDINHDYDGDD